MRRGISQRRGDDPVVAPHADSTAVVEEWLEFHGVEGAASTSGEWIAIRLPVAHAERMLNTKYGLYHHDKSKDTVLRTMSYSLPRELMAHVDVVSPTTYFGTLKSMRTTSFLQPELDEAVEKGTVKVAANIEPVSNAAVPASCGTTITPACLKGLYN
ncbi:hypothetical protein MPER_01192, partial [Moniliophthora perniciosa FA553]